MKKIYISDDCIVCGSCVIQSNLLKETATGKPAPIIASGIIPKNLIPGFKNIIDSCPVNAISITESDGMIKKLKSENLVEVKKLVNLKLEKYKDIISNKDEYKFNKDEFLIPLPHSSDENKYNYNSDSSAERAGLREFDRIMYSQRKAIIQKILVEYKTKILNRFLKYEKKKGNYYYDLNCEIRENLKDLSIEIRDLSNNQIKLNTKFTNFEVKPTFGINGDKIDRELYVYKIRHLEEIHIVEDIIRELEPLSWFDTYINTDDYEDYRGKDIYCYDLREVTEKFAQQILNEVAYILNYNDIITDLLKYPIEKFVCDVEKELNRKFEIIEKIIK